MKLRSLSFLMSVLISACAQQPAKLKMAPPPSPTYESQIPSADFKGLEPLSKIAFSSCADQDRPAPLWNDIIVMKPDLFLFMGDNIYASQPSQQPIADQYRKLDQVPDYARARQQIPFMATWDDHDFGARDGGADWTGKENARQDFLNYWTYLKNSLPGDQKGIYHAKIFGPPGQQVQVIMLDTRYFRSPLLEQSEFKGQARNYLPNKEGTILGPAQWEWLEMQLRQPAQLRFVVSSIQLIATEPQFEKWGNFPQERQRFLDLLHKTKAQNVIILSGDRHIASIAKMPVKGYGLLYEVTASSLNRANKYTDQDAHYVGTPYSGENFGLALIDWKNKILNIQLRGFKNESFNKVQIKFKN